MFFCAVCISFLIYWNENLLRKPPVWSKCHFLVIPSSPSLFDEKLSSSNSCVTSDLSIFLEPLVSSSGWKSTTTKQLLLEKAAWTVRKCHWLPEQCCLFSLCPRAVAEEVASGWWGSQGWWRCPQKRCGGVQWEEGLGCQEGALPTTRIPPGSNSGLGEVWVATALPTLLSHTQNLLAPPDVATAPFLSQLYFASQELCRQRSAQWTRVILGSSGGKGQMSVKRLLVQQRM